MVFRVTNYPASGNDAEMLKLTVDKLAPMYRSLGFTCNVMNRILNQSGPEISATVGLSSLEDYQKFRETIRADPEWLATVGQIQSLSRRPASFGFFVSALDIPGSPIRPEAQYYHRVILHPKAGRGNELLQALKQFVEDRQAEGRTHIRITRQVLSEKALAFIAVDSYENLAEVDNDIILRQPASVATLATKLDGLLESPNDHGIYEIVSKQ